MYAIYWFRRLIKSFLFSTTSISMSRWCSVFHLLIIVVILHLENKSKNCFVSTTRAPQNWTSHQTLSGSPGKTYYAISTDISRFLFQISRSLIPQTICRHLRVCFWSKPNSWFLSALRSNLIDVYFFSFTHNKMNDFFNCGLCTTHQMKEIYSRYLCVFMIK